ncbi:hypothetical protein ACFLSQ_02345 [Bacteroidota bacterium]
MYRERKLKTDFSIKGFLPVVFALSVLVISLALFGKVVAFKALSAVIFVYACFALYSYMRTGNNWVILQFMYLFSIAAFIYVFPIATHKRGTMLSPVPMIFFFSTIMLWFMMMYLLFTKKIKERGVEIFELAAVDIDEKSGSYTDRPMPIGSIDAAKEEIKDFAAYLRKELVCMTYEEDNRILFVPVFMGDFGPYFNPNFNYLVRSWVAIDFEGNISARISKEDYLKYKDEYSFDLLCKSFGELFIQFFEVYSKGEGPRIIDRMNAMKINPFT